MRNYIKSEWYRVTHTPTIYVFTGVLSGLTLLMNLVLWVSDKTEATFPYGTTAFSLSFSACSMAIIFVVGAILAGLLFAEDKKNGSLKNSIAFGISRTEIFLGKCVVSTVVSLISLAVILTVYMGSAVLLLEPGVEPNAVWITLQGVVCVIPMAVASEVLTLALCIVFRMEVVVGLNWYLYMVAIPEICFYIGLKFEIWAKIAAWMPFNYLSREVMINMSGWNCLWQTPEGVAKCLISGFVGLIVFLVFGLMVCKKQEV